MCPSLGESAIVCVDAQRSFCAEDFDWEGVEEFVGEDDGRDIAARRFAERIERAKFCFSGFEMISQSLFDSFAQGG